LVALWRALLTPLLLAGLAFALAGCGPLPQQPADRTASTALAPDPSSSALARIAQASLPAPGDSGFRLMPLGAYSLDTRLQLARRAARSLDVQYYVLEDDATGRALLGELRAAAERGVRVRLLVDDLYTGGTNRLLRDLAAFANVQVRLFNPFCCARTSGPGGRIAASLFDFKRVNHRMHNKLFIADGAMAVAGGRNIADEYFMRNAAQNFVDMDAFIIGAVVPELASIFDRYWNSEVVYPVEAIVADARPAAELRAEFERRLAEAPAWAPLTLPTVDVLGYGPLVEDLDAGRLGLVWGKARALADPPDKLAKESEEAAIASSVTNDVRMVIWTASQEVVITSPYLIPGEKGLRAIEELRERGVKVTVLTNSLAATDEPLVHTGYSRYRYQMLQAGVDLYELSPARTRATKRLGMFGNSLGRLHAKTAVVDRRMVFIGSMNLDPRSASQNTELGVFADSPQLAKELLRVINISRLQSAYRLRLQPDGPGIQWLASDEDKEIVLGVEPESTPLLRLHNILFGLFVPEQLL